jgi:putative DNA primase/helicase
VALDLRKNFEEQAAKHKSEMALAKVKLDSAKLAAKKAADKGTGLEGARVKIEAAQKEVDEAERKHPPRLITSDTTTEKLGEFLVQNPAGIAILRDELAGFLASFDKQGREGDRAFYLEAWCGTGSHDVDRIGRGSFHIPAVCVAISGTIQPNRLASWLRPVLSGGSGDDGLFQRIQLLVYPERLGEFRPVDRPPNQKVFDALRDALTRLVKLEPDSASVENVGGVPIVRFDDDAQQLFNAWLSNLESRLRGGDLRDAPAFEAHMSKFRGLMPALALCFHALEWAAHPNPTVPVPAVGLRAAGMAATWCDYLEAHAKKVYGLELQPGRSAAKALAERIKSGQLKDGMTVRDCQRREWPGLDRSGEIHAGLEEAGWVRVEQPTPGPLGGRPSEIVHLNPRFTGAPNG